MENEHTKKKKKERKKESTHRARVKLKELSSVSLPQALPSFSYLGYSRWRNIYRIIKISLAKKAEKPDPKPKIWEKAIKRKNLDTDSHVVADLGIVPLVSVQSSSTIQLAYRGVGVGEDLDEAGSGELVEPLVSRLAPGDRELTHRKWDDSGVDLEKNMKR